MTTDVDVSSHVPVPVAKKARKPRAPRAADSSAPSSSSSSSAVPKTKRSVKAPGLDRAVTPAAKAAKAAKKSSFTKALREMAARDLKKKYNTVRDSLGSPPVRCWNRHMRETYAAAKLGGSKVPFKDMTHSASESWKSIPEDEKTQHNEEYRRAREAFKQKVKELDAESRAVLRVYKSRFGRKRTGSHSSGYMIFNSEQVQILKNSGSKLNFAEKARHVGSLWNAMSDAQKAPYNETARRNYEAAVAAAASAASSSSSSSSSSE